MRIEVKPIEHWPGTKTQFRKSSQFKARWGQTLQLLRRELNHIGARDAVIHAEVSDADVRNDGELRANARPRGPGVIVAFEHRKRGWLQFPCDTFNHWQDNVRAIALALEALRKVDRYGVTKDAEQYAGFRALPSSTSETIGFAAAKEHIENLTGDAILPENFDTIRRRALRAAHPDTGGSEEVFNLTQAALGEIETRFGLGATQ